MASQKTRLEKTTLKQYYHKKLAINALHGTTLPRLKIDSKSLKTRLEWRYRILKISKTTTFSSASLPDWRPAVRPTSARRTGPILSITKALTVRNTDLLFEEDLSTAPWCFLSSFEFNRLQEPRQEWWEIVTASYYYVTQKHWFVHVIKLVRSDTMFAATRCFRV